MDARRREVPSRAIRINRDSPYDKRIRSEVDGDQSSHMLSTPAPRPSATDTPNASLAGPVTVTHSVLMVGRTSALRVTFSNTGTATMTHVVVRALYGSSGIDFSDSGTFRVNSPVSHFLKSAPIEILATQQYYGFDDPQACVPVAADYVGGTSWQNSTISATPGPLPTPVPDAIYVVPMTHWTHGYPTSIATPTNAAATS